MPPPKTIKQQIITNLYGLLPGMEVDGRRVWNLITKERDLASATNLEMPAVGIEVGDEETIDLLWPCLNKRVRVFIPFKFSPVMGLDVYDTFDYYLGLLQYRLLADKSIAGLAIDIHEAGNSPEIADRQDPRPGGVLYVDILYRVRNDDPYRSQ
jgi:hypothetical protein